MTKINSHYLGKNTNAEHFKTLTNIDSQLQLKDPIEMKLEQEIPQFHQLMLEYTKATGAETLQQSSDLSLLDDERDRIYRNFFNTVEAYTHAPVLETARAAQRIYGVLSKFGREVVAMSYEPETGKISQLCSELLTEEHTTDLTTIHGEDWVPHLQSANDKFDQLYIERTKDNANHIKGLTKKCRNNAQAAFDDLCEKINAYTLAFGEANYLEIINFINEEVANAHELVKIRNTYNKKDNDNKRS